MTTQTQDEARRRVRPWLAALLTLLGWGVGFYYARQSKTAWRMVLLSVVFNVVLGFGAVALIAFTNIVPPTLGSDEGLTIFDLIGWVLTALVAVWAWVASSSRQQVQRGSPLRLVGYLSVALVPVAVSLALAFALRVTLLQPYRIPSGAMQPTLQVGDYVVVAKSSYGYSRFSAPPLHGMLPPGRLFGHEPQRGDIAVFRPVPEPDRDFIKRIIGMPGDRIQMIDGALHINGQAVQREALGAVEFRNEDGLSEQIDAWRETLPNGITYTTFDRTPASELDNTRVFLVPEGHYFMMGDDRDNSADSRVSSIVGYVPYDNLVGRADYLKRGAAAVVRLH